MVSVKCLLCRATTGTRAATEFHRQELAGHGAHRQQHFQLAEAENNEQLFSVGSTHINH